MRATLVIGDTIAPHVEVLFQTATAPGPAAGLLMVPWHLEAIFDHRPTVVLDVGGLGRFEARPCALNTSHGGVAIGSFEVTRAPDGWAPPSPGP
jgi:hypothetical protein